MIRIPTQQLPNQEFSVVLDGQNCVINIRQQGAFMYLTLTADRQKICDAHVCQNATAIPVWNTPTFKGRLFFVDTGGGQNAPRYEELGDRFELYYATEEEWLQLTR